MTAEKKLYTHNHMSRKTNNSGYNKYKIYDYHCTYGVAMVYC